VAAQQNQAQAIDPAEGDTSRASRRIVAASVATVALIAAALGITILSHRSAVDAEGRARAASRDSRSVQLAETYFWREREAMNEYLLIPQAETLREVNGLHEQVRRILAGQDFAERGERELVAQMLAAESRIVATFKAGAGTQDRSSVLRLTQELNTAEAAVLTPMHRLVSLNENVVAESERDANATSTRGLVFGVIAGAFALAGGSAFALYGVRLVRRIGRQNQRLRKLDQMKDDFVASVSHELRTPLTSIQGYLDLVLEGEAGEVTAEQERFLAIVRRNAERLLRVVGDLLFVAEADAGKISLDPSSFNLRSVLSEAVDAARPAAIDKDIELSLDVDDVPTLFGDPARIAQVFDNLVSNAVKFTPEGGRVSLRAAAEQDAAVVEVADTGMGISPEDQKQLFGRFFRTAAASDHAIQGTGLGLAIVQAIVDAHGGSISVESEVGRGTTFKVKLPLQRERTVA
jgi:signal transduction histidine kinase